MRREFPTVALGSSATTFDSAEALTNGGMVSGLRARFAAVPVRKGLSPVAATAQLAAREAGASGLRVLYPRFFSDDIVAEVGGQRVVLRAIGARSASAQTVNGKLLYEESFDSVDAIEVPDSNRSEELLLLADDRAPLVFDYEIVEMTGVAGVVMNDGAIRFLPPAHSLSASQMASGHWEASTPSLEIERPWVVDAMGKRSESAARWTLGQTAGETLHSGAIPLTIRLTLSAGLTYPLVVDPSFSTTGSLGTGRILHTATLLPNGKVLIAGGFSLPRTTSAELYDPASGTFSATGPLGMAHAQHTATLLPNGKVLIAGGQNDSGTLTSAELYDPASGTFSATGPLGTARNTATATLLPNGTVLIAGGQNDSVGAIASAELYDPASGTFSATGPLGTSRSDCTATLLPNGTVLLAGGLNSTGHLTSAELYNPASGTFSATGPLGTARSTATATLLPNGKVLLAGGVSNTHILNSAELYNPASGTFSATGPLGTARTTATATLLPNGKVLVAGGTPNSSTGLASAELYDPASGTFSATGSLGTGRFDDTAALLPNGKVLIAGGTPDSNTALASAELYDPASGTFSATGSLGTVRALHTGTLLPSGMVLIAGGTSDFNTALASAELYDPASGTFSATGLLGTARRDHTATLLANGKVLIVGGDTGSGGTGFNSAELYDPAAGTFSATGPMSVARFYHTATLLPNGKVLIAGGCSINSSFSLSSAELYDPVSGSFSAAGALVGARREHTATLLANGKVLLTGGFQNGAILSSAELYDSASGTSGTFSATGSLGTARFRHTSTLLPNGNVLIAGGGIFGGFLNSAELYDPASETFGATGSLGTVRDYHTATLLENGKVLIAGGLSTSLSVLKSAELYDPANGLFSVTGSMAAARESSTSTLLPGGKVLVAGGNDSNGSLASAELYDAGDGYLSSRRPVILTAPASAIQPAAISLTGSLFEGDSEAAGGGTNNAATNYPILQLVRIGNEETRFILPGANWSATSFTSVPLFGLTGGYYRATIFTNGIPSISNIVLILGPTITSRSPNTCLAPAGGDSITLTGTNLLNGIVTVNGNAATVTSTTSTSVVFTTPAGTAGSQANVIVTTTGGTAPTSFAYVTATPAITTGGPTTFCTGGSVTLTSSSASGNQWYLNGNPIGGATNHTYNAAASGNYTVTVTVSGCSSTASAPASVTVNPIPATPTITPGGPTTFCGAGTLTSSSASGNQWLLNGNPIGGATSNTYSATASGNYTVVVTTTGCSSPASAATVVTVNPIPATPTITPGGPTTFCAGGSVTLTSSSASGNQWYLSGNPIGGATSNTYSATVSGNYTVVVTTTGCSSAESAATTVTVNPIPSTPTITPGGQTTFCAGGGVTLTSSSAAGNQWLLNGNPIGGATSNTYSATASGNYTVVVTTTGCSSAASVGTAVTVNPIPSTPTITPGSATTFCAGGSVTLTSSSAAGNQWLLNGNPIGGATNNTYVATASGNYTVAVTTSGCTSASSATTTVTVNPNPNATITASAGAFSGTTGNLASVANGGVGATYAWGIAGGAITAGAGTNSITYTAGAIGTLTLNVTVTTSASCSDAKSANVNVTVPPVTVTSVAANFGTDTGGSSVTINGTGFKSGAGVTFGGSPATSVVIVSAIEITAMTPAHAMGAVNLTVTNTDTSAGTLTSGYTFDAQVFDPNGDTTTTSADIFYLVNYLFLNGPAPQGAGGLVSGDANGDGVVTSADIFYLVNYLFLGGQKPNALPNPVRASAVGAERPEIAGSIMLGKATLRAGRYVVPVIMTINPGSITPQSMSLRVHFQTDRTMGTATVHSAGAAKDAGTPLFEIAPSRGDDLAYLVSFDPRNGGLNLGDWHSAIVAEIEIEAIDGNVAISIDPQMTMLSDLGGETIATVGNGKLKVSGTTIGSGLSPRPRTGAEVN